jgi:hypothetical protein
MSKNNKPDTANGNGPSEAPDDGMAVPLSSFGELLLGVMLITIGIVAIYGLITIWPAVQAATTKDAKQVAINLFWHHVTLSNEVALLLVVTFASALGSSLHAAISFADFVGNERLERSWVWWYVLRTFVGVALAVLFYFALRGGLFSGNTPTDVINPFGIGAIAGLVGLFSKQATDKLREVFDTMFRTAPGQGDDQRGGAISNPQPRIGGVVPTSLRTDSTDRSVRLQGEGFLQSSVVRISRDKDGRGPYLEREMTFVNVGELCIELDAADLQDTGTLYLAVLNPPPGGGQSSLAELSIDAPE